MKKKSKTIFHEILLPLLGVLVFEILFMFSAIFLGGVIEQLDKNATDILRQQTENRANYLLNEMAGNWSELELLSDEIDSKVQKRVESKELRLEDLNEFSDAGVQLLKDISSDLINTMYSKKISGIFVILNAQNPGGEISLKQLQGIYLRDLDPTALPSEKNADLLWERAPVNVVRSDYITTDSSWKPFFSEEDIRQDYFSKPFQAAYGDERRLNEREYGYWTTQAYMLSGDNRTAVSYSIPLILDDGTVYGVLGVEILTDYLQSILYGAELMSDGQGVYMLGAILDGEEFLTPIVLSGKEEQLQKIINHQFGLIADDAAASEDDNYFAAVKELPLYSNNAPFDADKWYLLGISSKENLFAFSRHVQTTLFIAVVVTFLIGLIGILFASYRLSKPIMRLSDEAAKAQLDKGMPILSATGIREIDQLVDSISCLEQEVTEVSTRMLSIMNMASVELAGYELQEKTDSVFVTDNYFPLLGVRDIDVSSLTVGGFLEQQKKIDDSLEHMEKNDGSTVYKVPQPDGGVRYFRWEYKEKNGRKVGLIEDVTASTMERLRIEHERDCDALTKLYARTGFKRETDRLFAQPDILKCAGFLMIDLDNLKTTNDRFGHNFGDLYIQTAGRCFEENTPSNTVCARMAGDEFNLFFYGYDSKEQIRKIVEQLYQAIRQVEFILPNGDNMGLSASGGLSWFPDDSRELPELMKYADFAMYQVKRSRKGEYREFDLQIYEQQLMQDRIKQEFHKMLETRDVNYFFQPIFDSRSGTVYAYEALMRANTLELRSPATVLRLAKEEDCMKEIELMTVFRATECFKKLLVSQKIDSKALLFINSAANICMTEEEEQRYHELYADLQQRVVIEITETENLDMEQIKHKQAVEGFSGMFALDDYGSGYNSEINLLELKPKFVKIDISIVRNVNQDLNKQQMISGIVNYAHQWDMLIIAEGIETEEELRTILELDVDLLQGYFLARPGEIPSAISEKALEVILGI